MRFSHWTFFFSNISTCCYKFPSKFYFSKIPRVSVYSVFQLYDSTIWNLPPTSCLAVGRGQAWAILLCVHLLPCFLFHLIEQIFNEILSILCSGCTRTPTDSTRIWSLGARSQGKPFCQYDLLSLTLSMWSQATGQDSLPCSVQGHVPQI